MSLPTSSIRSNKKPKVPQEKDNKNPVSKGLNADEPNKKQDFEEYPFVLPTEPPGQGEDPSQNGDVGTQAEENSRQGGQQGDQQKTFAQENAPTNSADRSLTSSTTTSSTRAAETSSTSSSSSPPVVFNPPPPKPERVVASSTPQPSTPIPEPTRIIQAVPSPTVSVIPPNARVIPGPHFSTLGITLMVLGIMTAIFIALLCVRYTTRVRNKRKTRRRKEEDQRAKNQGSPLFGGRERSGMTPLPSSDWTTFPEMTQAGIGRATGGQTRFGANKNTDSAMNLIPPKPPTSNSLSDGSLSENDHLNAVIQTASKGSFMPPTITVTGSSPTDGHRLADSSESEYPSGKEYALVQPPKLTVVNDDSGRDSGCSWDDHFGVELGVRLQKVSYLVISVVSELTML